MKFTAHNNYVVVKLEESIEETQHVSGFYLAPEQSDPCIGEVVSVGPYCASAGIKEGAKVLVPPFGVGEIHRFEEIPYLFILDHEIYGLVDA